MAKTIDQKIDDLALAMAAGFESVEKRFEEVDKKIANLPDKSYLDDKLVDLKV